MPKAYSDRDLRVLAIHFRRVYWRSLGDDIRAQQEPSEESLAAWVAVVRESEDT